ncbi:MAG: hypothetical protein E7041_05800 [Lentisphaerae bacterium]|nr:hypothetical protein [Lentisphaerota bacterium]
MKKFFSLFFAGLMIFSTLLLTGCGRSDDEIYADCAPVVEKIFADEGIIGAECTQIVDIREAGDDLYTAVACMKIDGKEKLYDIEISYDNSNDMVIVTVLE